MMIKKKLGVLSAAIAATAVAGHVNAAFDGGSLTNSGSPGSYQEWVGVDSSVVLFLHDSSNTNGSAFINLTSSGVTVDSLLSGTAFMVDFGAALTGAGGNLGDYDSWGLFATSNNIETTYGVGVAGVQYGVLFAQDGAPAAAVGGDEAAAQASINSNNTWFAQIIAEAGGDDAAVVDTLNDADFDNTPARFPNTGTVFNSLGNAADLYFLGINDATPEGGAFGGVADETVSLSTVNPVPGTTLSITGSKISNMVAGPVIPVPAAAWLFGSALLGLGVARRRS